MRIPTAASSAEIRALVAPKAKLTLSLPALMEPQSATATMTRSVTKSIGGCMVVWSEWEPDISGSGTDR